MTLLLLLVAAASAGTGPAPTSPENLLQGPARCVLRYLDAVRLAGPRIPPGRAPRPAAAPRATDYQRARLLTAPRALAEADHATERGEDHPLAPWRDAARGTVLESFQLLAVRRAPRGAAIVTVRERLWRAGPQAPLERAVSEYLVARVGGDWRVVARRPGGALEDDAIATTFAGWFDDPAAAAGRRARAGCIPVRATPGPR